MADSKKDSGASEVQALVDEAEEKGYLGTTVDETPRSTTPSRA
jgi:hypothetical protein